MASKEAARAVALCAALVLPARATREGFERRMGACVGRSEGDLVAALGVPARAFQAGNRRFVQYERRRLQAESYPGWGWRRGAGVDVRTLDRSVTFEVDNGTVEGFTSRGNDCVAASPS